MGRDTLFNEIKNDFLTAYVWAKPNTVYVWKAKDNKAVGLLISYIKKYYKDKELSTEQMRLACRVWLNKAFTTAPEWLRKDGSFMLLVAKFEVVMESPDPRSAAASMAKHKQSKTGFYDARKHEIITRPIKQGEPDMLSNIIKTIGNTTE